jgi:fatty acid desaturase
MQTINLLSKKFFALVVKTFKRGSTLVLPQDEVEQLQVLHFIFKAFTILLVVAALFCGVWLTERGYPSWTALLILMLRLLYALPAKRVERALRMHQARDREKVRIARAAKSA